MQIQKILHIKTESKISSLLLIFTMLIVSCAPAVDTAPKQTGPAAGVTALPFTTVPEATATLTAGVTDSPSATAPETTTIPTADAATAASTCASADVRKLAESIAADYAFTSADEVLVWFCNGAEFEDSMVALQTEDLTAVPAEDMLKMRVDGLSWDEIWQAVGLAK